MWEYLVSGSVTVTCLVAMVTGLFVRWIIQKWKYNPPPGPRGLPVIGNVLQINDRILHEQALEWSKQYGPVITVRLGFIPILFINSIDAAMEVLVKRSTDFASRMTTPSSDVLTDGGKDIAFANYGPTWKLQRRIAAKALRQYMQGDALENRINDALQTAFEEIDKVTGAFDPVKYINFIIGNILTGLCFGGKYKFDDPEITYLMKMEDELIERLGRGTYEDFLPALRYVYKSEAFRFLEQFSENVRVGFMQKKYNEAKNTFDRDQMRHFCDSLILVRQEALEEEGEEAMKSLTEEYLVHTVTDIFFAGIDTSRHTLTWAIHHMLAFPDIQAKVQEELDRVVGKDRLPSNDDRPHLSYTEAVLHESMRLSSVVPTGILHKTSCDTEVGGYRIPAGTLVAINHWALHNDPDVWEDVDRFIPERFLDENGKLGPKPKNWLPFSAGKRVCLGEFVAKPQLHLIFAQLMQRYKWKMESGKCADLNPAGNFISRVSKPFEVIVERRK